MGERFNNVLTIGFLKALHIFSVLHNCHGLHISTFLLQSSQPHNNSFHKKNSYYYYKFFK